MPTKTAQQKLYRKQIGNELKVRFPDGRIVRAWQLWEASLHSSDAAAAYLPTDVAQIEALYENHAPEIIAKDRKRRALRMALKLAAFEVLGGEGDAADLRILALANGLIEADFSVVTQGGEPMLVIESGAMRRLGANHGDSTALH